MKVKFSNKFPKIALNGIKPNNKNTALSNILNSGVILLVVDIIFWLEVNYWIEDLQQRIQL